jgi:lysophospholipase L1-like esterase
MSSTDLVLDGNSLIEYMTQVGNTASYATLGAPGRTKQNFGVAGQTTTQMQTDAVAQIDSLNKTNKVLIVWEYLNDAFFGATAVQAAANMRQYCISRRTAGWRVLLLTTPATINSGLDTKLVLIDKLVKNSWQEYANGLLDVRSIPELANAARTDMYYDNVHLSNAGYMILYRHLNEALRSLRK